MTHAVGTRSSELDILTVITAWGRRHVVPATDLELYPSASSDMTSFPSSPSAYLSSSGAPDQTGSPGPPTWAPHGPVPQAAAPGPTAAAAAKQLDKIPSCLFDTIRQEVMTPKELWQLREVHTPLDLKDIHISTRFSTSC